MMKKELLSLSMMLALSIGTYAVPAYNKPVRLMQADGSYITILGHGDEYRNFVTTEDGYTIVRGQDKVYHYAKLQDGVLVPTDVIAHDATLRSNEEVQFLTSLEKCISAPETKFLKRSAPMASERKPGVEYTDDVPWLEKRKAALMTGSATAFNKNAYRGLLILVNYNDCTFSRGNDETKSIFSTLMNGKNVTSFYDPYFSNNQTVTGSVRDYFYDNSYGQFDPQFDVVGPVTIDYSQYYVNGEEHSWDIACAAVDAVDNEVDFSKYDADGDGMVDMFYIIYAGRASSYSGNDERLLWPHQSQLYRKVGSGYLPVTKDGKILRRFACSTELYGWEVQQHMQINGIGTICHEFSHVLGYEDHYDTGKSGYEVPASWDVMSAGNYNGTYGETPAGYNAYERLAGGFLTPTTITKNDVGETISLPALSSNANAYRINSNTSNKEFLLIENRQNEKWDSQLPGYGMLIWRVDSTNSSLWTENRVNATSQLCLKLLRANGWRSGMSDSQADAFPGSKNVSRITNTSSPSNLMFYSGAKSPVILKNITMTDGVASCLIVDPDAGRELPEGTIFYESFDDCNGTGGNDGIFDNEMNTASFNPDYDGWSCNTKLGCDRCARFGSSPSNESILLPTVTLDDGITYTLKFLAAPYYNDGVAWTLSVAEGNAVVTNDSAVVSSASPLTFKMTKNAWKQISFTVTGSGNQVFKLKGYASSCYRILLDEVIIKDKSKTGIEEVYYKETAGHRILTPDNYNIYNLAGQRVTKETKGILIINGKKIVQ